jgi:tryptophanyl-tRNA synthetase
VVVPEPLITEAPLVPGTDGEKMSKSRGNALPIFADEKDLRKMVMKIKTTGSESLEEPKVAAGTVWSLFEQVVADDGRDALGQARRGQLRLGPREADLFEALNRELTPLRERYTELRKDERALEETLLDGAGRARSIARRTLDRVRSAIGVAAPSVSPPR